MQRCLGRGFIVTGVPLEKGMGEGDFVSGSPETGRRVLRNLELWRAGARRLYTALATCLLAEPLSRLGDRFCSFNFSFAFCGAPELCEIDHPLIG